MARGRRGSVSKYFASAAAAVSAYRGLTKRKRSKSSTGNGTRKKRSMSMTKTRTKRKGKKGGRGPLHENISLDSKVITLHRPVKLFKSLGGWRYLQQNVGKFNCAYGQQNIASLCAHYTLSQFLQSSGVRCNSAQAADAFYNLNPYQATTGSVAVSAVANPSQDQIHCHDCNVEIQLVNFHSAPATLQLFWITPKLASGNFPENDFDDNLQTGLRMGQVAGVQTTDTSGTQSATVAGYSNKNVYGESMLACKPFMKAYRILKSKTYEMGSGGVEKVNYTIRCNKTFDKATLVRQSNNVSGYFAIPGSTVFLTAVLKGTPVDATNSSLVSDNIVTTSNPSIGFTIVQKYRFSTLGPSRLTYSRVDPQFASTFAGTTTKTSTMSEINTVTEAVNA